MVRMKTDITTPGAMAQSQNRMKAAGKEAAKEQLKGGPAPLPKPSSNPDYKVDLSTQAQASSSATTGGVTPPSLPSAPPVSGTSSAEPKAPEKKWPKIEAPKIQESAKEGSVKKPAIIFIKGLDVFSSPSKSERGYAGVGRMAESIPGARIYGWNQKDEILAEIKKTHASSPVILVGHSLGGDTAVEVANEMDSLEHKFRPVDLLITMDSTGFNNDIIPQNVKNHLNVFGENNTFLNDGPHVARRHDKTNVKNILSALDHTALDDSKEIQFEVVNLIQETLGKKGPA